MESSEGKLMFERKNECCLGGRSKCKFLVVVVNSRQFFGSGCKFKPECLKRKIHFMEREKGGTKMDYILSDRTIRGSTKLNK